MTIRTRITTAIATGAVLAQALSPLAFAADQTITGNGALSTNQINSSTSNTTVVEQNNNANVSNVVSSTSSTGGNTADFNTGGNTTIVTGNATNTTQISTAANLNQAQVAPCGNCAGQGADLTISNNGAASNNQINEAVNANRNTANVAVGQNNNANVYNGVSGNASTGGNSASHQTNGDVAIVTGNAVSDVTVVNTLNQNRARVGGGTGAGSANDSELLINGNGALSVNQINSARESAIVLAQNNSASVSNIVASNATTGANNANFNTGGNTIIGTGYAKAKTVVSNTLNMNVATVDCSCVLGGVDLTKIGGNGAASVNVVNQLHEAAVFAAQNGNAALYNGVGANSSTGANGASFGTGSADSDPAILTGAADNMTVVSTTSNANVFGQGSLPLGMDLTLNFGPLMGLLWWL